MHIHKTNPLLLLLKVYFSYAYRSAIFNLLIIIALTAALAGQVSLHLANYLQMNLISS